MKRVWARIAALGQGIREDKNRLLAALAGAILLWFLLGGEVEREEKLFLNVRVVQTVDESGAATLLDGITIRVPPNLAVEDFDPPSIELTLRGTREDLSQLEGSIAGSYKVPADVLQPGEERREFTIDATRDVDYPKLKRFESVDFVERALILLKVTKRERIEVPLTNANLVFEPPELGEGFTAEFNPSVLPVSGPADQIQRIARDFKRFKLGVRVTPEVLDDYLRQPLLVPTTAAFVTGPDGAPLGRRGLLRVHDGNSVGVKLNRERLMRQVEVKNLPIYRLAGPLRPDVDPQNPLSLEPGFADVKLSVPQDWFSQGNDEGDLRDSLRLFVDPYEIGPTVDAGQLRIQVVNAPAGSQVSVLPESTDAYWRRSGTVQDGAGGG